VKTTDIEKLLSLLTYYTKIQKIQKKRLNFLNFIFNNYLLIERKRKERKKYILLRTFMTVKSESS
jgi:hypothetical protein